MDAPATITGEDVGHAEQAIRYELTTLAFHLPDAEAAKVGARTWVNAADARGHLVGCWEAEHGVLGRVYVLRQFHDERELGAERQRAALSRHPFGAGPHLADLAMNAYAPFPFMPPVVTGEFGSIYEIRDYHLLPGGLPATIDGWRVRLPGRHVVDPIAVVMYALDGPARIVQIWPFNGLDERIAIRRQLVQENKWPPPGGPEHILEATSTMAWPLPGSPLH